MENYKTYNLMPDSPRGICILDKKGNIFTQGLMCPNDAELLCNLLNEKDLDQDIQKIREQFKKYAVEIPPVIITHSAPCEMFAKKATEGNPPDFDRIPKHIKNAVAEEYGFHSYIDALKRATQQQLAFIKSDIWKDHYYGIERLSVTVDAYSAGILPPFSNCEKVAEGNPPELKRMPYESGIDFEKRKRNYIKSSLLALRYNGFNPCFDNDIKPLKVSPDDWPADAPAYQSAAGWEYEKKLKYEHLKKSLTVAWFEKQGTPKHLIIAKRLREIYGI